MTAVVIGVGCAYGIMGRGELIEYVAVGNGINSKSCEYHWHVCFYSLIILGEAGSTYDGYKSMVETNIMVLHLER